MNPTIDNQRKFVRRHLMEGWGGLFLFACLGLTLEALLAYRAPQYVNVESETRRLMWRLAHAHGTLLSLVQLGLSFTFSRLRKKAFPQPAGLISGTMTGGSLLIPGGFFLAGLDVHRSDPGVAIALVPAGAVLLLLALGLTFVEVRRSAYTEPHDEIPKSNGTN